MILNSAASADAEYFSPEVLAKELAFNYFMGFLEAREDNVSKNKTANTDKAIRWAGNGFVAWITQARAILERHSPACKLALKSPSPELPGQS